MDRGDEAAREADSAAERHRHTLDGDVGRKPRWRILQAESRRPSLAAGPDQRRRRADAVAHALNQPERVGLRLTPRHVGVSRGARGSGDALVARERRQRTALLAGKKRGAPRLEALDGGLERARQRAHMLRESRRRLTGVNAFALAPHRGAQLSDRRGHRGFEPHLVQQQRLVADRIGDVRGRSRDQVVDEELKYHLAERALLRITKELADLTGRFEVFAEFGDLLQLEQVAARDRAAQLVQILRRRPLVKVAETHAEATPGFRRYARQRRVHHVVLGDLDGEPPIGRFVAALARVRHQIVDDGRLVPDGDAKRP